MTPEQAEVLVTSVQVIKYIFIVCYKIGEKIGEIFQ